MLTNSLLAGALGAAYLTIARAAAEPAGAARVGDAVAVVRDARCSSTACTSRSLFYVLMVGARVLRHGRDLARVGERARARLAGGRVAAAVAAVLMWLNVRGFCGGADEDAARRMTAGAIATTAVGAACCSAIAIAHYSFGRRGSRVGASLFVDRRVGSLALPLAARGPGGRCRRCRSRRASARRADAGSDAQARASSMLLLDGASLEYICRGSRKGGCRTSRAARQAARRWIWRPSGPTAAGSGVGGGRDRNVSGEERRPVGRGRITRAATTSAVDLLPDHCFSHALVHARLRPRPAELLRDLARAAALEHPVRCRDQRPASCAGR